MALTQTLGYGRRGMNEHDPVSETLPTQPAKKTGMVWRLVLWLTFYALTLTAYNVYHPFVNEWLVRRLQVEPAAEVLRWTMPGTNIATTTTTIRTPTLELQILRGCDGIEAWLLLVTAILVFPMPWRKRGVGMLLGTVLMIGLNIVRIVTLFHIALRRPEWMDVAHGFIWQSLIVLAAAAFVLIWTDPRQPSPSVESTP